MRPRNLYRRTDAEPLEPLVGREHSGIAERDHAEHGSRQLRSAINSLFRTWEQTHGFQEGAAQILLPAGYSAAKANAGTFGERRLCTASIAAPVASPTGWEA